MLTSSDAIALASLALSAAIVAIQAVHYVLSLANSRRLEALKAQIAVQLGDLRVYMHERFVTKDELDDLLERKERTR